MAVFFQTLGFGTIPSPLQRVFVKYLNLLMKEACLSSFLGFVLAYQM